jgi:hypothetical protein
VTQARDHDLKPRLAALGIVAAVGMPLLMRSTPGPTDPYRGSEGPLEAIVTEGGTTAAGEPIQSVRAGGAFAWITTLCPPLDAQVSIDSRFARIAADNTSARMIEEQVLFRSDRNWPTGGLACGPLIETARVPRDAPPGDYVVLRTLTLHKLGDAPVTRALPPIRIVVSPASPY